MGPSGLRLAIAHPGSVHLSVRWSPYWRLSGVRGCVSRAGQFTHISADTAGHAELDMSFSVTRVGSGSQRCD